ncbi:MAG: efflux RND transporter permease subunit, partial [Oscillospiraceae bacterium]|nr:efflux RND transporter permease subunit [Oscillospiraceae bacterium]
SESMTLYIVLEEEKSRPAKEIVAEIKEKTADLPGCVCQLASSSSSMMSMMESGVSITVKGGDLDELQRLANEVADILSAQEGLTEVNNGLGDPAMELRISVNKEAAMKYSLTVAQVYQQVAAALTESTNATTLSMLEEEISVLLVKHDENKLTYEQLKEYPLTYTDAITGETNTVALSELAVISEAIGMTSISHDNFVRRVNVTAAVEEGYNIGLISRELEEKIDGIKLPDGYSLTISGENEMINSTLKDLIVMILMAILMIYFIMVAQFQSFTGPFIVLFTIPLAMTGGLLALWIFGFELSVISMLGFLVLCGVVVNNGIVFVDTANQLQRKGMERRASLIEAGKMRMRPIFMTTITTVLGLVMLALGIGTGADMLQPMAVVVIFGLLYATLLTLFIVPVLCDGIFMRKPMGSIEVESELEVPDEYDDALPVMAAVQPNNKDAALEELPSAFKEPVTKEEPKAEIKNDSCVIHLQSGPTVEISVRELIKKTPEVLEKDRPAVEKADDQPREEKDAALQIAEEELPIFGI